MNLRRRRRKGRRRRRRRRRRKIISAEVNSVLELQINSERS